MLLQIIRCDNKDCEEEFLVRKGGETSKPSSGWKSLYFLIEERDENGDRKEEKEVKLDLCPDCSPFEINLKDYV